MELNDEFMLGMDATLMMSWELADRRLFLVSDFLVAALAAATVAAAAAAAAAVSGVPWATEWRRPRPRRPPPGAGGDDPVPRFRTFSFSSYLDDRWR